MKREVKREGGSWRETTTDRQMGTKKNMEKDDYDKN